MPQSPRSSTSESIESGSEEEEIHAGDRATSPSSVKTELERLNLAGGSTNGEFSRFQGGDATPSTCFIGPSRKSSTLKHGEETTAPPTIDLNADETHVSNETLPVVEAAAPRPPPRISFKLFQKLRLADMIFRSLAILDNKKGCSISRLRQYMGVAYAYQPSRYTVLKRYLRGLLRSKKIIKVSGVGLAGSFKLAPTIRQSLIKKDSKRRSISTKKKSIVDVVNNIRQFTFTEDISAVSK